MIRNPEIQSGMKPSAEIFTTSAGDAGAMSVLLPPVAAEQLASNRLVAATAADHRTSSCPERGRRRT